MLPNMIKSSTVYVGNLPDDVKREELEDIFGTVGPIRKSFVIKGKKSWYGYVTFALPEDADSAVDQLVGHQLRSRQLLVQLSQRRSKRVRPHATAPAAADGKRVKLASEDNTAESHNSSPPHPPSSPPHPASSSPHPPSSPPPTATVVKSSQPARAHVSGADKTVVGGRRRRPRLVVRNISFQATDEAFAAHFSAVGAVVECRLLRRPANSGNNNSGKLVGCGFVEFRHLKHAQLALCSLNNKPLLGRNIVIDWAVDKASYTASQQQQHQRQHTTDHNKDSGCHGDDAAASVEDTAQSVSCSGDIKNDHRQDSDSGVDDDEDEEQDEDTGDDVACSDDESDRASDVDDSDVEGSEQLHSSADDSDSAESRTDGATTDEPDLKSVHLNDASQGRTLFIKNLSFDTDTAALRQLFDQFGPLTYAVLCVDPLTEHARGTAFVQFKEAEHATAALTAATDDPTADQLFQLDGRRLHVLPAVTKQQLTASRQLRQVQQQRDKDKRNLYLTREGLVREGTRAADGVSVADLSLRVGLEKWKARMLKNTAMFVSRERLCVHNLPAQCDDVTLRRVFVTHAPPSASITEARVMRDRRDTSQDARGTSKQYGFVTFSEHEHALAALRAINNNPLVFTEHRRPVVEFSVENRVALAARQKRLAKSRQLNPTAAKLGTLHRSPSNTSKIAKKNAKMGDSNMKPTGKNVQKNAKLGGKNDKRSGVNVVKRRDVSESVGDGGGGRKDGHWQHLPAHAGATASADVRQVPSGKKRLPVIRRRDLGRRQSGRAAGRAGGRATVRAGQRRDLVECDRHADNHSAASLSAGSESSGRSRKARSDGKKKGRDRKTAGGGSFKQDASFSALVNAYKQKLCASASTPSTGAKRWFH